MNVFYNAEGIGDTLLVYIADIDKEKRSFEKKGNVVRIFEEGTNKTAGYNISQFSEYESLQKQGQVTLTEEFVDKLNQILEGEGYSEKLEVDLSPKFVVGHVVSKEKHPDADKLSVCQVDVKTETLQIVCGAPNVEEGQKVVVAKAGAVMPSGLVIKDAELRGVASSGMICSAKELNLPDAPQEKGILVLEASREVGEAFQS
ncbi:DUF4479 domain-containing protein [Bacillus lacus]|uniref:DUF4479 domain-containing protein n=1 Tax=Metabacillus lacus TaxID=1983721 RepID=A0A7X2J082_9BACI|nr:DUF4479 family protein [Metabacillus lacus]MRX72717.1 DUF4479 domain-containing protein [Metabacillus lacus]